MQERQGVRFVSFSKFQIVASFLTNRNTDSMPKETALDHRAHVWFTASKLHMKNDSRSMTSQASEVTYAVESQ